MYRPAALEARARSLTEPNPHPSDPVPSPASHVAARRFPVLPTVLLFVVSGATGLVDQLCFAKYLTYIVGSTAYAVSAVLAAFMTGLALGAHLAGKRAAQVTRPLYAYGVLELVVAAFVAVTPFGFELLTPVYASVARSFPDSLAVLSVSRWLVALALVIVPTTAMGATLPLLSRALELESGNESRSRRERLLGALYAANTFGGAMGSLAAAYAIVPALGVRGTLLGSALASALVGVLALYLGRGFRVPVGATAERTETPSGEVAPEPRGREAGLLAALAFASGCLVFAAEVVFTHLLALIIGNSAYAFGLILAIFLLCLFFGARADRLGAPEVRRGALPLGLVAHGARARPDVAALGQAPLPVHEHGRGDQDVRGARSDPSARGLLDLVRSDDVDGLHLPALAAARGLGHERGEVGREADLHQHDRRRRRLDLDGYLLLPPCSARSALSLVAGVFAVAGVAPSASWAEPRGSALRPRLERRSRSCSRSRCRAGICRA